MAKITNAHRVAAWNVVFLDGEGDEFAGFYHNTSELGVTFSAALGELLANFSFEYGLEGCEVDADPSSWVWALWPANNIASYGATTLSHSDLSTRAKSMAKVMRPGRYFVLRHMKSCKSDHLNYVPGFSEHVTKENVKGLICVSTVQKVTALRHSLHRPALPDPQKQYNATIELGHDSDARLLCHKTLTESGAMMPWMPLTRSKDRQARQMREWDEFATSLLGEGGRCAITDLGAPTVDDAGRTIAPGLAVEAYHVIPPQYFDVFPSERESRPVNTWLPSKNGILLLPHIHDLFRARLVAIHPETLRIRCFLPCDLLKKYNGQRAVFCSGKKPPVDALRWHWCMCVAENLTARSAGGEPAAGFVEHTHLDDALRRVLNFSWSMNDQGPGDLTVAVELADLTDYDPVSEGSAGGAAPGDTAEDIRYARRLVHGVATTEEFPFCTQNCLLGLKHGRGADEKCPNYEAHLEDVEDSIGKEIQQGVCPMTWHGYSDRRHEASRYWIELMPGKFGRTGQLVKIITAGKYVFVGKGMPEKRSDRLFHEHDIYQKLEPLQGTAVTTCLGVVRLHRPWVFTFTDPIEYLLLQAWAGEPVDESDLPLNEKAFHIRLSSEQVFRFGVLHIEKGKHLLWSKDQERVMVIDFENDAIN